MPTVRRYLLALLLVAAMSLSFGCGTAPENVEPAQFQTCTVSFAADGSVACSCEVKS